MLTGMISKPSARPFARGLRRIQESSYAGKSSGSGFRRSRHSGAPEGRTRNLEVMKRDSGFDASHRPGMTRGWKQADADDHSFRRHEQGAAGVGGVSASAAFGAARG